MNPTLEGPVKDLFEAGNLTLISGPCVIESYELCSELAMRIAECADKRGIPYIFKASFDKANRTSLNSFRGPGLERGLEILAKIRDEVGVPVLTDFHSASQAKAVAEVVDVLQIPAFLCRQTDLIVAAAQTGKPTCIKKGQFVAPQDMQYAIQKFQAAGGNNVALTERGTTFGYQNLVVDMRALEKMRATSHCPIIFDATHSVQQPSGSNDGTTSGNRTEAPLLARAAAAVGIDGLFAEVHPDPDNAKSDGPNSLTLELLEQMLDQVTAIDAARRAVFQFRGH